LPHHAALLGIFANKIRLNPFAASRHVLPGMLSCATRQVATIGLTLIFIVFYGKAMDFYAEKCLEILLSILKADLSGNSPSLAFAPYSLPFTSHPPLSHLWHAFNFSG
jgi:hypothetical protein